LIQLQVDWVVDLLALFTKTARGVVKRGRCLYLVLLSSGVAGPNPLSVVKTEMPIVVVPSGHCEVGEGRTVFEGLDKVLVIYGLFVVVLPIVGLVDHDVTDGVDVCQGTSVV